MKRRIIDTIWQKKDKDVIYEMKTRMIYRLNK